MLLRTQAATLWNQLQLFDGLFRETCEDTVTMVKCQISVIWYSAYLMVLGLHRAGMEPVCAQVDKSSKTRRLLIYS